MFSIKPFAGEEPRGIASSILDKDIQNIEIEFVINGAVWAYNAITGSMKPLTPPALIESYGFDKRRNMAFFLNIDGDFQSISVKSSAQTIENRCINTLLSYKEQSLKLKVLFKPKRVIRVPKTWNYIITFEQGAALFVDLQREQARIIPYVFTSMMRDFKCFEGNILAWLEDENRSIKFFDHEQERLLCSFDEGYSIKNFHYNRKRRALATIDEENLQGRRR